MGYLDNAKQIRELERELQELKREKQELEREKLIYAKVNDLASDYIETLEEENENLKKMLMNLSTTILEQTLSELNRGE